MNRGFLRGIHVPRRSSAKLEGEVTVNSTAVTPNQEIMGIYDAGEGHGASALFQVLSQVGALLSSIDGEGNLTVFQGGVGAGGIFGPFVKFDSTTEPPSISVQDTVVGETRHIYLGIQDPTVGANYPNMKMAVDDWFINGSAAAGSIFNHCTVAWSAPGTPGTLVGFW